MRRSRILQGPGTETAQSRQGVHQPGAAADPPSEAAASHKQICDPPICPDYSNNFFSPCDLFARRFTTNGNYSEVFALLQSSYVLTPVHIRIEYRCESESRRYRCLVSQSNKHNIKNELFLKILIV